MVFVGEIVTVAIYGFLKNFCPDGFYLSNILLGPGKNFTITETTQDVYPVLVYSNLLLTLVALLVTDILQYKTLIVIGALASVLTKVPLYWGSTIMHIQVMQLLFAVYRASQVAYRTYIYTKVKKHKYQWVTAVVHIAPKVGTLTSAVVAQLLISSGIGDLQTLIQMSFVGLSMALLTALTLPSVEGTAYSLDTSKQGTSESTCKVYKRALHLMWQEFKSASTNINVVKWCIWWILATGAFQLVTDYYIQALWNEISGQKLTTYNAGVEAMYACCSACVCYLLGWLQVDWVLRGELVFALCTFVKAAALLTSAFTTSMTTSFVLYITASTLYDMLMIISNSQVALQVKNDSFGLIFGINTFLALICQSVLTYILTSKHMFALSIREQFVAVGSCYAVLGLGFFIKAIHTMLTLKDNISVLSNKPLDVVITSNTVPEYKM